MPDTSKLSKYVKTDNVRDGELLNIVDSGVITEKTFTKDGKDEKKNVLEITVEYRGEQKTYSPNGTTIGILNKAWGTKTEKWVARQIRVNLIPLPNGKGDMIIGKPVLNETEVTDPSEIEM